jgi:O-Antigen ligase
MPPPRRLTLPGRRPAIGLVNASPKVPGSSPDVGSGMVRFGLTLTLGYLLFGRSWAYLGIAGANLYIGEVALAAIFVYGPTRRFLLALAGQVVQPGRFHILAVSVTLFGVFGFAQVLRGVQQTDPVALLKSLPLYYYPIFLGFGIWLGARSPRILERVAWTLAWANALYGALYAIVLDRLTIALPGQSNVDLFSLGLTSSAIALLGLLAIPRHNRWSIPLAVANSAVLFGHQVRAQWVGLLVAVAVWVLLTRQLRRVLVGAGALSLLLVTLAVAGVSLPGDRQHSEHVRAGDILGRALGAASPGLAGRYTSENRVESAAGTATFRRKWWHGVWDSSRHDPTTLMLGHGYGFNLQKLAPPGGVGEVTRNPHNAFFYTLGYTGWIGVALLLLLFGTIGRLLWQVFRITGNPIGLAIGGLMVTCAQFEPWLESPFGAAATYLLLGMCLAPLVRTPGPAAARPVPAPRLARPVAAERPRPQPPVPAARREAERPDRPAVLICAQED